MRGGGATTAGEVRTDRGRGRERAESRERAEGGACAANDGGGLGLPWRACLRCRALSHCLCLYGPLAWPHPSPCVGVGFGVGRSAQGRAGQSVQCSREERQGRAERREISHTLDRFSRSLLYPPSSSSPLCCPLLAATRKKKKMERKESVRPSAS